MKRIVYLTCIGSLALALTAFGAPKGKGGHGSAKGGGARSAHVSRGGGHAASMRTARHHSAARSHHAVATHSQARSHSVARANKSRSNRVHAVRAQSTRNAHNRRVANTRNRERNLARANNARNNRREAARLHDRRTARANSRINGRGNFAANRGRNMTVGRNAAVNRNRQNARVVNNWRNDRFRGSRYAAFYNYNRHWHNRGWWNNHYSNIVFVLGGWWYSNAGYWYPAWGYGSGSYYPYDGPIYGYNNLTPDRIMVNVQAALQSNGYYTGPIDGDIGPQSREALAAFQADNGLAVTSAIDGPTLQTLGLS